MNGVWSTTAAVGLVALGVLAEINLFRVLLRERREGRQRERVGPLRAGVKRRADGAPFTRWRLTGRGLAACLAAPALTGSVVHAQESPAPLKQPEAPEQNAPTKSPFSLQLNLDYTTAYFYHGIIQEDTGLILQPAAKLTINLYERDDVKVDGYLATWNSFHGQATGAQTHGDFTEYWYESDLLGGVALTVGKFSLATQYVFITSPSDAYETVQELDFTVAFDDSELLGQFALHPYALLGIETGADSSDGANSPTGTYLELGIAPGFSFDAGKTPIAISFPASVGLSLQDYYQNAADEDDTFGFVQVGVKASIPLPFGERYGKWTLNAGVSGMYLGDHTAEYNGGRHEQLLATVGLQWNF